MKLNYGYLTTLAVVAIAVPACLIGSGRASDHADTPEIAASPGTDLTDVYAFPSPTNPYRVVLAMNVHPLIAPGKGPATSFDPNVLYQFKIDNNGDNVEDLVIQARFTGNGPNQRVIVEGPLKPSTIGGSNVAEESDLSQKGQINTVFGSVNWVNCFAGAREDSFFFDLEQFFNILPDRATPINGKAVAMPNAPQMTSWRSAGQAVDFLSNGGYNVLSIVVDVPGSILKGKDGKGILGIWATTNVRQGDHYVQRDRLARPAVNEVFATVANNRHKINDLAQPSEDSRQLARDIDGFMTKVAGRSREIANVMKAVLVPDVLKVDLNGKGAAYLGVETSGATGGTFGGRALTDDVVDISLGAIFGKTIPALGLAADDGKEIQTLTSDNVGAEGKHFMAKFPFLGEPR